MKYLTIAILATTAYMGVTQASFAKEKHHHTLCYNEKKKHVSLPDEGGKCDAGLTAMETNEAGVLDRVTASSRPINCMQCHGDIDHGSFSITREAPLER